MDMGAGCVTGWMELVTEGEPGGWIALQQTNLYASLLLNTCDVCSSRDVRMFHDVGAGWVELVTEGVPGRMIVIWAALGLCRCI